MYEKTQWKISKENISVRNIEVNFHNGIHTSLRNILVQRKANTIELCFILSLGAKTKEQILFVIVLNYVHSLFEHVAH